MSGSLKLLGFLTLAVGLCCSARSVPSVERQVPIVRLLPVDEAAQDGELLAFRQALLDAIKRRDATYVIESSAPTLHDRFRFGLAIPTPTPTGPEFRHADWRLLERVLSLGGNFTTTRGSVSGQRQFCAPYTYSAYPWPPPEELRGELEPWVILGRDVPVYQSRALGSRVLARLSHNLVKADGLFGPDGPSQIFWAEVEYTPGQLGYVLADQIRSPDDYHACFGKIDGKWVMTRFERGILPER